MNHVSGRINMAATETMDEDSDFERQGSTERESFSTESSYDESPLSPRSEDSDWSFGAVENSAGLTTIYDPERHRNDLINAEKKASIVDCLLFEIYDQYHSRDSVDSDNVTECSTTSGSFYGGSFDLEERGESWTRNELQTKETDELRVMAKEMRSRISMLSTKLVKQLKRRDKHAYKLQRNFDVLTAILQAVSLKRRVDTKIRFSFIPQSGKKAYKQWLAAFKAIARLKEGVPSQWRRRLWLCLAESKIRDLDWEKTAKFCFNEKSNPDDDELGSQIVKDLHRTGCGWFCGQDSPEERAALKRVLLAYARRNKAVGYCQGFNVIAALILQVMERNEEDALKVMVYVIDHVLPANYFANNLRALSVDMAVLRDLMRAKLNRLSKHLDSLQAQALSQSGTSAMYEPPLINVFTMQWFLTLFATCLPEETVLRVWDSILLEGSEVLLRAAVAIWGKLGARLEDVETADEFYSSMGLLIQDVLAGNVIDCQTLMQEVYSLAPFPLPSLAELREQYTYNINPFSDITGDRNPQSALGRGSSDEEDDADDLEGVSCLGAFLPFSDIVPGNGMKAIGQGVEDVSDIAAASPGVFATDGYSPLPYTTKQFGSRGSRVQEEMSFLQKQYARMRQMQQNAVVVFSEATVKNIQESEKRKSIPAAINHLLVSATKRKSKTSKTRFTDKKGGEENTAERVSDGRYDKGEAKPEVKPNAYEMESMQHLNELFKGDQKKPNETKNGSTEEEKLKSLGKQSEIKRAEDLGIKRDDEEKCVRSEEKCKSVELPPSKKDKRVTSNSHKIQHVGLNGEVSSLETVKSTQSRPVPSLKPAHKPPKITVAESTSLTVTPASNHSVNHAPKAVRVPDKSNSSVPETGISSFGGTGRTYSLGTMKDNANSSWLLEEDRRCKYPENFNPFPQRNKHPSRSRILYGNMSEKGAKRIDAFQGKKEGKQGLNGVALNGTSEGKRS
ncbi:TBC1 domain family member 30-like [Montipora foliosa]|uniref:TBC1 domain family member 30-like n=1 Tax=Montipora foliosa TaxID=591990 RepID=UPI0035F1E9BD